MLFWIISGRIRKNNKRKSKRNDKEKKKGNADSPLNHSKSVQLHKKMDSKSKLLHKTMDSKSNLHRTMKTIKSQRKRKRKKTISKKYLVSKDLRYSENKVKRSTRSMRI